MKIQNSKWWQYLRENDGHYGKDIVSFIAEIEDGKQKFGNKFFNRIQYFKSKYANNYLGSGSFRDVYSFDDEYVIKVANRDEESLRINLAEIKLLNKSRYKLFPKVYRADKDGYWFVQERASHIFKDHEEFLKSFPNFSKIVTSLRRKYFNEPTEFVHLYTAFSLLMKGLDTVPRFEDLKDNVNLFSLDVMDPSYITKAAKAQAAKQASDDDQTNRMPAKDMNLDSSFFDKQAKQAEEDEERAYQDKETVKQGMQEAKFQKLDFDNLPTEMKANLIFHAWDLYMQDVDKGGATGKISPETWQSIRASDEFLKLYMKNPDTAFSKIYYVFKEMNIEFYDIKPSNTGINSDGEFMVVDSGILLGKYISSWADDKEIIKHWEEPDKQTPDNFPSRNTHRDSTHLRGRRQ